MSSTLGTVAVVLVGWIVAALVVGVIVGRAIRRRDLQVASRHPSDPGVGSVAPGPGPAGPAVPDPELDRLLAALDRVDGGGTAAEITDLARIWTARSAVRRAERELDRAVEQARHNGVGRDAIRAVLELRLPGTVESRPDQA